MFNWLSFQDSATERGWFGYGFGTTRMGVFNTLGVLELSGSSIDIAGDNRQLRIGAGPDLLLFHDGTNSFIRNDTGILRFLAPSDATFAPFSILPRSALSAAFNDGVAVSMIAANAATRFQTDTTTVNYAISGHSDAAILEISRGGTSGFVSGLLIAPRSTTSPAGEGVGIYVRSARELHVRLGGIYVTGTLDLGNTSDTTLARIAAGRVSIEGNEIGFRRILTSSETSGTLTAVSAGRAIHMSAGCTINNSVFAEGDVITFINTTAGALTITQGSGVTLRVGTTTGNVSVPAREVRTCRFVSASEAYFA